MTVMDKVALRRGTEILNILCFLLIGSSPDNIGASTRSAAQLTKILGARIKVTRPHISSLLESLRVKGLVDQSGAEGYFLTLEGRDLLVQSIFSNFNIAQLFIVTALGSSRTKSLSVQALSTAAKVSSGSLSWSTYYENLEFLRCNSFVSQAEDQSFSLAAAVREILISWGRAY